MSLDSTEKVYQSDLMHITPKADADIYGLKGDWVLRGLELDIGTGQVALHPGAALLQGRLYELSQLKTISTAGLTGNYWVGLNADLTQVNSSNGTFTNNQFTLTTNTTGAFGNLREGDIQAFIPLWRVSGGVPSRVTLPYEEDMPLNSQFINGWSATGDDSHIRRVGRMVVMTISIRKSTDPTSVTFIKLDPGFRPSWRIWSVCTITGGRAINVLANPSGEVYPVFVTLSTNDVIQGEFTWMIDQPKQ